MRILVSLALLFSACASQPDKPEPYAPPVFTCGSGDAICAAAAGVALVISAAATPFSAAERRIRARQISGTCEVLLPLTKGKDPCGTILLTVTDTRGQQRRAWVQDHDFEVGHLGEGPFTVRAESETYGVGTQIENVRLGSKVAIQFVAKPRVATPK